MTDSPIRERGATALLVAGAMLFIFGAAALAVDTSIFYSDARTDQTTADLSCLAGVLEVDDADKIDMAASFTEQNWPLMQGSSVVKVGSIGTMTGQGNQVIFETNYGGDPNQMRVRVVESADTNFARALGAGQVTVTQEAICSVQASPNGAGPLPIGIVPGGFAGGIFNPNPCGNNNGNCGGLAIGGNGASEFSDNVANGIDRVLSKHHGPSGSADADTGLVVTSCDSVGNQDECNLVSTKTGQMAGPLATGFLERFSNPTTPNTFSKGGEQYDADTPSDILGAPPENLFDAMAGSQPRWWEPSIYGDWDENELGSHYYYDGVVAKCDSPRRSLVPVVDDNDNWDLGSGASAWPNGTNSEVKVIALVDIIVLDPNHQNDFQGNGTKTVTADVIWYGPNATCSDGSPIGVLNGVTGGIDRSVKLIAG